MNWQCLQLLKGHAIEILLRTKEKVGPGEKEKKEKKRGYYNLVWEDKTLADLFDVKMDDVYRNKEHKDEREGGGLSFKEYMEELFLCLNQKLAGMDMEAPEKQKLVLDDFVKYGDAAPEEKPPTFEAVAQAVVDMDNIGCQTGEELMPVATRVVQVEASKKESNIQTKAKN